MNITADHKRTGTPKPTSKEEVTSGRSRTLIAGVLIAIMVASLVLIQSGIFSPSGSGSADETAALQTFNSFGEALNDHDAQAAIGCTTLHFLDPNENNSLMIEYFVYMFSNQSLVFSTADIKATDMASMSPAQKTHSELLISNITDQARDIHIDEVVTGYVMITGTMTLSGPPDLPEIDELVLVKIGNGWYIILGS